MQKLRFLLPRSGGRIAKRRFGCLCASAELGKLVLDPGLVRLKRLISLLQMQKLRFLLPRSGGRIAKRRFGCLCASAELGKLVLDSGLVRFDKSTFLRQLLDLRLIGGKVALRYMQSRDLPGQPSQFSIPGL